ncbi:MAG: hypothetical protein MUF66_08220, partial [Gammaproteobacteria bacterium]|nr:hypothetical protein [Gammaproteobacteria bacterium]
EQRADANLKINLWLPTLRIDRAVAVADLEATIRETARLLRENPYRQLLARVSDGAEVATRFLPYRPPDAGDPEAWARTVFAPVPGFGPDGHPVFDPATGEQVRVDRYTLMAGVTNAILFEYAARHEVTVELLPRENLLLSTKNAPGMAHQIKQVLGAASNAELYAIRFAFGDDRDAVSRVAVVLQQQPDYRLAVAGPFRLDTGPAYTPASVPSAHIAPIPAAVSTAAPPATAPPGQALPAGEAFVDLPDADVAFDVDALIEQAHREADARVEAPAAPPPTAPPPERKPRKASPAPPPASSAPAFPRPQL